MRILVLTLAFLAILGLVLALDENLEENGPIDDAIQADDIDLDEISRALEADDTKEDENNDLLDDLVDESKTDDTKRAAAKVKKPNVVILASKRAYKRPRNCRDIKNNGQRLSGLYKIYVYYGQGWWRRQVKIIVYCEMSIGNGPYTFLPRRAILKYPTLQLGNIVKNRRHVLLRYQDPDTTQPYTKIEQLNAYANRNLGIRINSFSGYTSPLNVNNMDRTYLFLGFLPKTSANNNNIQGFKSNGQQLTFRNCDRNPNSYFAFFPNHFGGTPSNYGHNWNMFKLTNNWLKSAKQPSSHRTMPNRFFFFTEHHFGGCGAYWQSNRRYNSVHGGGKPYKPKVYGVAIGFA